MPKGPPREETGKSHIASDCIMLDIHPVDRWNAFHPRIGPDRRSIIGAPRPLRRAERRIAGVSGILGGLARPQPGDISCGSPSSRVLSPRLSLGFLRRAAGDPGHNQLLHASGRGLLVGIGTRYGGGCTSGHADAGPPLCRRARS